MQVQILLGAPKFQLNNNTKEYILLNQTANVMKNIPQKFLDSLRSLLNNGSKEANRLIDKLENEPDASAAKVEHLLGSQTGPIKFSKPASYTKPVKFSSTGNYGNVPDDEDDVYTVEEFKQYIADNIFIDYDGHGYPVKDGLADKSIMIFPSRANSIPNDATHIVWYNR